MIIPSSRQPNTFYRFRGDIRNTRNTIFTPSISSTSSHFEWKTIPSISISRVIFSDSSLFIRPCPFHPKWNIPIVVQKRKDPIFSNGRRNYQIGLICVLQQNDIGVLGSVEDVHDMTDDYELGPYHYKGKGSSPCFQVLVQEYRYRFLLFLGGESFHYLRAQ